MSGHECPSVVFELPLERSDLWERFVEHRLKLFTVDEVRHLHLAGRVDLGGGVPDGLVLQVVANHLHTADRSFPLEFELHSEFVQVFDRFEQAHVPAVVRTEVVLPPPVVLVSAVAADLHLHVLDIRAGTQVEILAGLVVDGRAVGPADLDGVPHPSFRLGFGYVQLAVVPVVPAMPVPVKVPVVLFAIAEQLHLAVPVCPTERRLPVCRPVHPVVHRASPAGGVFTALAEQRDVAVGDPLTRLTRHQDAHTDSPAVYRELREGLRGFEDSVVFVPVQVEVVADDREVQAGDELRVAIERLQDVVLAVFLLHVVLVVRAVPFDDEFFFELFFGRFGLDAVGPMPMDPAVVFLAVREELPVCVPPV